MHIYQFSIKLNKLNPPKKYNMIGEKIYNETENGDSLIGEVTSYNREEKIANVQLYESLDENDLCSALKSSIINVKYTKMERGN